MRHSVRVPDRRSDPSGPADPAAAWAEPSTRAALAAYRGGSWRWLLGGMAGLAIGTGTAFYAVEVFRRPGLGPIIVGAYLIGLAAVVVGVLGLLRAVSWQIALLRGAWRRAELRGVGQVLRLVWAEPAPAETAAPTRPESSSNADRPGPAEHLDVALLPTARWRSRVLAGHRDSEILVRPVGAGRYVLAAGEPRSLYGVRALRRQI